MGTINIRNKESRSQAAITVIIHFFKIFKMRKMNERAKFAYQGNQMKTYEWVLFDADDTLFHFDAFSGLRLMLSKFGVNFTNQDYHEYQTINKSLWTDHQNGHITIQQLKHQRFNAWAEKLHVSPYDLNSAFLSAMTEISTPPEEGASLLNALKGEYFNETC